MTVIKLREVMYVIDIFTMENPHVKSPWTKYFFLSLIHFVSLDRIPKIKICHVVASDNPGVVEGRLWLISMDIFDSEVENDDGFIDNYGDALYEEYESGLVEAKEKKISQPAVTLPPLMFQIE